MSTTEEQKKTLRLAQIEDAWWSFFTKYRLYISDNTANQQFLEEALEAQTLPITAENIAKVFEAMTPEQRARFAAPDGRGIKPRTPAPAAAAATPAAEVSVEGILPSEFTRRRITKDMSREEYQELLKKFGAAAIEARVNGVN